MKHVKIYEQLISESKDLAIEYAKELKSQGYNAISDDDTIEIEIDKNPFDKKFKDFVWTYTLYLSDGDFRVSGGIPGYTDTFGNLRRYGSGKWTGFKIKSVEDIIKAIKSPKGWNAKFNWGKWSSYWDIVLNKKSQYRQTKKGDLSRRDIKDMLDMWDGFKGAKLSKHPTTGSNIIIWDAYDWEYYWDGEDVWYGSIEKGKKFRYGSINSIEALKYMSDNLNPQQSDRSWEANENLDLGQIGGMGEVSLPVDGELGSGDIPAGKGDAEEEYKKRRNKNKQKEMKNIISFESFKVANEGMSKSAIKKAIKVIDQQIEDEEGGDGEPLDNETLQALEQERERLLAMNEGKFDGIGDLVKSLHFEMDPKTAEEKKIELGKRQGEVTKRKQIEGGNYSLRRFRKEIKYWDGNKRDQEWAEDVFAGPEHYNTVKSTLGAGPHTKPAKKVRWTQKKYDQWLEDVASNDGWKNASDMAQNAQFEPGLIDWVEKNFRGEDAMQRIQWDIEAFAESTDTKLTHLKSINEDAVLDKNTDDEIFDSETYYTISKVLAIARKSKECKEEYKRESNFGNGLQMAERLKKEFPKIQFRCRVYRSAWNYGGNLCLSIDLRGKSYKHEVFKFQSNNSTRKPNYSFSKLFNGTKKVSTNEVEDEWGMGIVHGSYQSISSFDKFMDDVVGVFKDYKRVNGKEFDMKEVLAGFKANDKILAEWTRLKPRIEKQYEVSKASARKAHRRIELRMPYIRTAEKKVYYKTDEPRELRHPDEYGQSAYDIIDGRDYAKYEAAQAKISDIIEKFCKKHNFEFVWAASW